MARPVPPRHLVLGGIVAACALSLAGSAVVDTHIGKSMADWERTCRTLQRQWHARPFQRDVLWGESHDGRAFDHYEAALAALAAKEMPKELRELRMHRRGDTGADLEALRARWQPLLDAMAAGAHARDARPTPPGVPVRHVTNLLSARALTQLAMHDAERALANGDHQAAVTRTLDAATFALDLLNRGSLIDQMIGCACLAITTQVAWPDEQLARLDDAALRTFADGLQRLDEQLDPAVDGIGELTTTTFVMSSLRHAWYAPTLDAWRFGFSNRAMFVDAFTQTHEFLALLARERTRTWPQRLALIRAEVAEFQRRDNRMLSMLVPNYESAEATRRETVAHVRLLRMAVAARLGAALEPLPDPLGDGQITVRTGSGGTTLRCAEQERRTPERFVAR